MAAAAVGAYLVARRPSLTAGGRDGSGPKPPSAEIDPASNRSSITSSGGSASSSASGRGAQPPLVFEDEATGVVFEAPSGSEPERDATGRLAFRAIGYTPWPVDKGEETVGMWHS